MKCKSILPLTGIDRMKESLTVDIKGYALQTVLNVYNVRDINTTCLRRS